MRECSLHIKRGAVYKVNVPVTAGVVVSAATVWTLYDDRQQTFKAALSEGEDIILGPYVNITKFRIQMTGNAAIEEIGDDFRVPVSIFDNGLWTGIPIRMSAFIVSTSEENYTVTTHNGLIRADTTDNTVNANLPPSADFYDSEEDVGFVLGLRNISGENDANYVGNGAEKIQGISPYPVSGDGNMQEIISIGPGLGWELK